MYIHTQMNKHMHTHAHSKTETNPCCEYIVVLENVVSHSLRIREARKTQTLLYISYHYFPCCFFEPSNTWHDPGSKQRRQLKHVHLIGKQDSAHNYTLGTVQWSCQECVLVQPCIHQLSAASIIINGCISLGSVSSIAIVVDLQKGKLLFTNFLTLNHQLTLAHHPT